MLTCYSPLLPATSCLRPVYGSFRVWYHLCAKIFTLLFSNLTKNHFVAIFTSSQRHWSGAAADCRHQQPRHHQVDPAWLGTCEQIQVLPVLLHHDGLRACCQHGMHHYPWNKWVMEGPESNWLGSVRVWVGGCVASRWRQREHGWALRRRIVGQKWSGWRSHFTVSKWHWTSGIWYMPGQPSFSYLRVSNFCG